MKKNLNNNCGFTLIEIVVILIIIGVLAVIAIPNLFSFVYQSRANEAFGNINSIRPVLEGCIAAHPGSESTCTSCYMFPNNCYGPWISGTNFGYLMGGGGSTCQLNQWGYGGGYTPTNGNTGYSLYAIGTTSANQLGQGPGPFNNWPYDYVCVYRSSASTGSYGTIGCVSAGVLSGTCSN